MKNYPQHLASTLSAAIRWCLIFLLILLPLASPAAANSVASHWSQSQSSPASSQPHPFVVTTAPQPGPATDSFDIRLQRATFDPLKQPLALSPALSLTVYPADGTGYYLVQFSSPILPEWKTALQQSGATIFDYVPQFAYLVRMNGAAAKQIAALDFVRWVRSSSMGIRV